MEKKDELDPVLRCDSCNKLVKMETIHKIGCCKACGNKRMRSLTTINSEELEELKGMGLAPEWLAEWEVVDDED